MVELARVNEEDAMRWTVTTALEAGTHLDADAARELVDALGADMMMISSELEKLLLYTLGRGRITLGDVETMVLGAKQRSLYELTDAISARDRVRALALLHGLLNSSEGGEDAAIGHLYMLARTFRQMLVILEKNVRDSRAIWQALWQGFRIPPFAADDLIRQARRYKSRRELTRALRLVARADLELRSSPPDKKLVLERLVYELASEPCSLPSFRLRCNPYFRLSSRMASARNEMTGAGLPSRSKITISFSPFFSHGPGRYSVPCGPMFQNRPSGRPLTKTSPLARDRVSMNVSAGSSTWKVAR
jgi:hypothetical protein